LASGNKQRAIFIRTSATLTTQTSYSSARPQEISQIQDTARCHSQPEEINLGNFFLSCIQWERDDKMARGNQRDKAREKNLKEQAGKVCLTVISNSTLLS
jgi:hypothetical protein